MDNLWTKSGQNLDKDLSRVRPLFSCLDKLWTWTNIRQSLDLLFRWTKCGQSLDIILSRVCPVPITLDNVGKNWTNTRHFPDKGWTNTGQNSVLWTKCGQSLDIEKDWTNHGQTLDKLWTNFGHCVQVLSRPPFYTSTTFSPDGGGKCHG